MVKHLEAQILGTVDDMAGYPIVVARENADLQVVNTTTETEILEYTVPANYLSGDHGLRVTLNGFIRNETAAAATWDLTLKVKLGATTMFDVLIPDCSNLSANQPFRFVFELMAKDADNVQEAFGETRISTSAGVTLTSGEGGGSSYGNGSAVWYGEATEDGTVDLVLAVTADLETADPDFEVTRRRYLIEYL